ncbi:MAG: class I SAM-dependent methyltransferase [Flavobacteriales bacterium]|nr:MAG: class I SAM-dependent methyltransferase [Flavobacteriales bacterium]
MNKDILATEVQKFIINYSKSISELAFSGSPFPSIKIKELLQQIENRNKVSHKLPTWFQSEAIYYPPKLNLEQTSSEITAKYKSTLVKGKTIADITGGFGVDSYYFSKYFTAVIHCEKDKCLSAIAAHNFKQLKSSNITCIANNGLNEITKHSYDLIYIDPSRRHEHKGRVYRLIDCEPNIPKEINKLFTSTEQIMIKTSPMLDITQGIKELKMVSQIHIVAVNNDVKEVLWLLQKGYNEVIKIKTINIGKQTSQKFNYRLGDICTPIFSLPEKYLYEPNAAIMKSGAFNLVSERYSINKLHQNSHLYTSKVLKDFPGRRFLITRILKFSKKDLKELKAIKKANLSTRNFPESVASLRNKMKIADGGNLYLFFTTDLNNNKIIICCTKA